MEIPKKIKIGGIDYDVVLEDLTKHANTNMGNHGFVESKIWIDSKSSQQQQDSTLIHEILEAVNKLYEIDLKHKQICVLESSLYQVLKDNKLNFGD